MLALDESRASGVTIRPRLVLYQCGRLDETEGLNQPGRTLGGARGRVRECVANRILVLSELEHRGTGGGCRGLEQGGERAGGRAGSDVARVAGVLKEVCVDVERDRDARVAEDAADLGDVEPEVDDQVARDARPVTAEDLIRSARARVEQGRAAL
jgi:hypothetical protein